MPRFSYFISHFKEAVTKDSPMWQALVPLRRDAASSKDEVSVSHGDYFRAARSFLETNSYKAITRAVSRQLGRDVKPQDIAEICICLQKHGEFYHPSRIEAVVDQTHLFFVLNVAISESGRRIIETETHHLNRLNADLSFRYLPQVYESGRVFAEEGLSFGMLLGEWFNGYHEFHISIDPADKKPKITVWDDVHGRFFLSAGQINTLYAEASKILTCYYNLESFEQILSWHHAAGDFVVKTESGKLELKLITVRRYAPFFGGPKGATASRGDPELILQALLIFFLNLSIRMRLDRLDGVGEWMWSDKAAVEAVLIGFLEALSLKPSISSLPDSPLACFMVYLSTCTAADIYELSEALVNRFNPQMPELTVVKKNLSEHVETLHGSIQQILSI